MACHLLCVDVCPSGCPLQDNATPAHNTAVCDACSKEVLPGATAGWGSCRDCDYDICGDCLARGVVWMAEALALFKYKYLGEWGSACFVRYFNTVGEDEQGRQFLPVQYYRFARRRNNRPFCGVVDVESIIYVAPLVPDLDLGGGKAGLFKMNEDAWLI